MAMPTTMSLSASSSSRNTFSQDSQALSSSQRHHPYSLSRSASSRSARPRSATSASAGSSQSGAEDDDRDSLSEAASMDLDERSFVPATPLPFEVDLPSLHVSSPKDNNPNSRGRPPKAKASHARKTSPDHIKRPPNAFIMFRSHCCNPTESGEAPDAPGTPTAVTLAGLGITDHRHISRIASILWKGLEPGDKSYWERRAKERKEEHALQYPGYKYKPVFRNKDEIRRRKKAYADAMDAEKRGCEEVARALMNAPQEFANYRGSVEPSEGDGDEEVVRPPSLTPEEREQAFRIAEFRAGQTMVMNAPPSIWTLDQVKPLAAALTGTPSTDTNLPLKKRGRPTTAAKRKLQDSAPMPLPISMHQDLHPLDPRVIGDFSHEDFRPHSAPAGDFPISFGYGTQTRRRSSHIRSTTSSYQSDSPFSYMVAQDDTHNFSGFQSNASQGSHLQSNTPQPSYDSPSVPSLFSSRNPPSAIQMPQNPSFIYYSGANGQEDVPQDTSYPPLSPRSLAIAHMQSYSIHSPPPTHRTPQRAPVREDILSPTGTAFVFGTSQSPTKTPSTTPRTTDGVLNLTLSGMKRRGTLGRIAHGGDMMLISPTTSSFLGGRKTSLGRWEVRKVSVDQSMHPPGHHSALGPHPLSRQPSPNGSDSGDGGLESYDFNTDFLETIQLAGREEEERRNEDAARERGQYAPSPTPFAPSSAASEFSEAHMDRQAGVEGQYWHTDTDAAHQKISRPFHVGHTDFFVRPDVPLSVSYPDQHTSEPQQQDHGPLFSYPSSFDRSSFDANSHRPSIATLLSGEYHPYADAFQYGGPSEEWLSNRVGRDSEATIRWNPRRDESQEVEVASVPEVDEDQIRISALSSTREEALAVLEQARSLGNLEAGLRYVYLCKELINDSSLIEQILQSGFGVTYDHLGLPGGPAEADFDPQTARQPTFDSPSISTAHTPISSSFATF
ncbi:hypothetical protein P7C70_g1561, partial [Phenoliferia sp. Uapishka_3]